MATLIIGQQRPSDAPIREASAADPALSLRKPTLVSICGIGALFVGLISWSVWVPLASSVSLKGTIVVQGDWSAVQHPDGGVVRRVLVADGDHVVEGQGLLELEGRRVGIAFRDAADQFAALTVRQGRLLAEQNGGDVRYPGAIYGVVQSRLSEMEQLESQLLIRRRQTLAARKAPLTAAMADAHQELAQRQAELAAKSDALAITTSELATATQLAHEGAGTRTRVQELEKERLAEMADIDAEMTLLENIEQRGTSATIEAEQVEDTYQEAVASQLTDCNQQLSNAREQYEQLADQIGRLTVRAPTTGVVIGMSVHAVGNVVAPGLTVMNIVPRSATWVVEGHVSPSQIGQIETGTPIRYRMAGRSGQPAYGMGTVVSVSADRLSDRGEEPYFLVRGSLPRERSSGTQLRIGGSIDMMIQTGRRSTLEAVFEPLSSWLSTPAAARTP